MDKKEYYDNKIKPILEGLIFQLVSERPENPANFILDWLQKTGGYSQHELTTDESEELEKLKLKLKRFKSTMEVKDLEQCSSDPYLDSEDEKKLNKIEDKKRKGKGKRSGVSPEAYDKIIKKENYIPRVIQKTNIEVKRIRAKITQSFLFNSLDETGLNLIIGAMEEKIINKGEYVIRQGDRGNCLYYVEEGRLDCLKRVYDIDEEKLVKQYTDGDSFGEMALLYNKERAASVVAGSRCILWALDRETFIYVVKNEVLKKRETYKNFLKSVEAFKGMDDYEINVVCDVLTPCVYQPGEYVIKEGEKGDIFYIVEEGKAIATKILQKGIPAELVMHYSTGSYFGELALIKEASRAASVIAVTELHLLAIDRHSFKRLLKSNEDHLRWRSEIMYRKKSV